MWEFSLAEAFGLLRRTAPFLAFRMAVYLGVALAHALIAGAGAGLGWGVAAIAAVAAPPVAAVWGGGIAFALALGATWLLRDYLLYLVKAAHVALMVDLIEGRPLPPGGQVAAGQRAVAARFGTASALFALDRLIAGVAQTVTGLVQGLLTMLPLPGLRNAAGLLRGYLRVAVGLVDEAILAHILRIEADNPWEAGRDAVVLYAQNARPILRNAAWLAAFVWLLSFAVFLAMLAPAAALVWLLPGPWTAGGALFAAVFAWAVKAAVIEPFAIACLLQVYLGLTRQQTPNPDWTAKLDSVSDRFRTMGARAGEWAHGRPAHGPAPAPDGETGTPPL